MGRRPSGSLWSASWARFHSRSCSANPNAPLDRIVVGERPSGSLWSSFWTRCGLFDFMRRSSCPCESCCSEEEAFKQSVECITGPISRIISRDGIDGVYKAIPDQDKETFTQAYCASFQPCLDICQEIYDDVASGNEIKSVVQAVSRFDNFPMGKIDQTHMWQVGEWSSRSEPGRSCVHAGAFTHVVSTSHHSASWMKPQASEAYSTSSSAFMSSAASSSCVLACPHEYVLGLHGGLATQSYEEQLGHAPRLGLWKVSGERSRLMLVLLVTGGKARAC